jgi:RNA polymerase sigma factor (sigma-70 family)
MSLKYMDHTTAIDRCKKGDPAAQRHLFDEYAAPMMLVCRRYVKRAEDAEEMLLNGFFKFFQQIDRFQDAGAGSIAPWLRKIMVNECLMFLRSHHHLQMAPEVTEEMMAIDEEAIQKLSADEIYQYIIQLPVGYRTVFNLYVMEEMTHREIADVLGISEGTSKSQLSKARGLLQKIIRTNEQVYASRKSR